ncbi:hypothetical protein GIB67_011536 [Kingdonia uniflora]|uniref:Uncharacterized protein n=1 Tax=Kingdonia uniflora TaxID=39325 RepID=A0A7J7NLP1_9MAGN|nr:hypothetical protein GIB67_011536 [Kingdonia uniflora]
MELSSMVVNTIVVEDFGEKVENPSTKVFVAAMKRWGIEAEEKAMFLLEEIPKNVELLERNIPTLRMLTPRTLNLFDIFNSDTKPTLDCWCERYGVQVGDDEKEVVVEGHRDQFKFIDPRLTYGTIGGRFKKGENLLVEEAYQFCLLSISEFVFKMKAYSHFDRVRFSYYLNPKRVQDIICKGSDLFDMLHEEYTFKDIIGNLGPILHSFSAVHLPPFILNNAENYKFLLPVNCKRKSSCWKLMNIETFLSNKKVVDNDGVNGVFVKGILFMVTDDLQIMPIGTETCFTDLKSLDIN